MSTMETQELADVNADDGPNIVRIDGMYLCSGIKSTFIPEGGAHVRQVFIDLPVRFNGRPAVTALVHPRENPAAGGVAFVIYNVTVVASGTSTRVKISATNNAVGQPVDGLFECDYVIIGKALSKGDA
jgi:hypothetical protein